MTTASPSKPAFWKRKWPWITLGAVVVVGAIGALANPGGGSVDAAPTESPSAELVAVPDVVGLPGNEAYDALTEAGFDPTYDGGDDAVVDGSNWDATGTAPEGGTEAEMGAEVVLSVERAEERLAAEQQAAEEARAQTPIDVVDAQTFCTNYADQQFPYGVDMHWIMGKLAEEQTDTGWFFKVEADVTNEFGAEQSGVNIECHISGTNGAPVMDDFLAY